MKWIMLILPLLCCGCIPEELKITQSQMCFEVIDRPRPESPIMINKCNGATWMLIPTGLLDEKGNKSGMYVYRWESLHVSSGAEVELKRGAL